MMPGGTINWSKPLEVLISDICNEWIDATIVNDNIDSVELEYFNYSASYREGNKKKPYRVTVNHQGMIKGRPDFGVIVRNKKPESNATTDPRNEAEENEIPKIICDIQRKKYNIIESKVILDAVCGLLHGGYVSLYGNTKEEAMQKKAIWEKFASEAKDIYVFCGVADKL